MGPSTEYELLDLQEYNRINKQFGKAQYIMIPSRIEIGNRYNMWLVDEMTTGASDGKYFHFFVQVMEKVSDHRFKVRITDVFVYHLRDLDLEQQTGLKIGAVFECEQRHFGAEQS